jgi:S1-C subfamily serine protease/HEAT repeat protein/predicted RNA-binding Zn-ribbon protein involved in translation (DUF1610 family)
MSAPLVVPCPACGQHLKVEPARTYKCPKCGTLISTRSADPRPVATPVAPRRQSNFGVLSLEDESPSPGARSRGRLTALTVVVALLVVGGVAAGVYFTRDARQSDDTSEAPATKQSPTKESPPKKPAEIPVAPEPPRSAPQTPAATTFLPEPVKPREFSGDEVYRRLLRSTVFIVTPRGAGSGVLVDGERRLILTNDHVVRAHQRAVVLFPKYDSEHQVITNVRYYNDRAQEDGIIGRVLSRSERQDLALIQIDALPEDVRAVRLAGQPAPIGITVYSIGGSGVGEGVLWRLTTGTVRSRARQRDLSFMCLETQSATNRGDSGGPMVNARVELVGIVQGGRNVLARGENLIDYNVDLSEVRDFVGDYFRSKGETWKETDAELESSPNLPGSDAAFDNLLAVLKAGVPADRVAAARRLGALRGGARSAIPSLLTALDGADQELQEAIAAALAQIGAPAPGTENVLVKALSSKSAIARTYALKLFVANTPLPAEGAKAIASLLQDASADNRALAATALGKMGSKARSVALGPLLERLADSEQSVRDASASALKLLGTSERTDRDVLLDHMKHDDIRVRAAALTLLRPLATSADDIRTIWLPLLNDSDVQLRLASVTALTASSELFKSAEKELMPLLADSDPAVRRLVALAARSVKDKSAGHEKLIQRLESEADPAVREALAGSLLAITAPEAKALPLFRSYMKDPSAMVREAAIKKIAAFAHEADAAVPDLIERIGDSSDAVRAGALLALAAMGPEAKGAIPPATRLFDRQTPEPVLVAAVRLLAAAGPDGIARLEAVCQKSLPQAVREEMCRSFNQAKSVQSATLIWMIEQAETLERSREVITETIAKVASSVEIQELLRHTLPTKPRQPGEKPVVNPADYRVWAIITLRKLDFTSKGLRDSKEVVIGRFTLLASSSTDSEVVAEAKAALAELKK